MYRAVGAARIDRRGLRVCVYMGLHLELLLLCVHISMETVIAQLLYVVFFISFRRFLRGLTSKLIINGIPGLLHTYLCYT